MTHPLHAILDSITLGVPVTHETLTMIPILGSPSAEHDPRYLTPDDALGRGWTESWPKAIA